MSLHALSAVVFAGVFAAALAGGNTFSRRLRRPTLVRAILAGAGAAAVPLNVVGLQLDPMSPLSLAIDAASLAALGVACTVCALLRIDPRPTRLPRRVLAVGAHPDDLELACGGTLAKLADSGHEIHVLVMSDGNQGGDRGERAEEAHRGAAFLGASSVSVHDFPDTKLREVSQQLIAVIEGAVARYNPDIILTHSGNDQHQDHEAVHDATLRAARQHATILCFESPSATRAFNPSVFVDIEDYVDVKVQGVRLHRDQSGKPYMTDERVRGLATFRGAQAKRLYAEGYEPVRLLGSALGDL